MKSKSIIVSFVFVVAVIIAGGYFAYTFQKSAIFENRHHELSAIRELKTDQIVNWRKERIGDANLILYNPLLLENIKEYLRSGSDSTEKDLLIWFDLLKNSYGYSAILMVDEDFNTLLSSEVTIDFIDKEHLSEFGLLHNDEEILITDIHLDKKNDPHYSIRINFSEKDEIYCRLIFIIDPYSFIFPLIQNWPTPSNSAETILVRIEGDSLLILNEPRHRENAALNLSFPVDQEYLPAAQAAQGHTGFFRGIDYRGKEVLADIGSVPGTNWFIITKVDEAEIIGMIRTALVASIIIVLLLIAMSYFIFMMVYRSANLNAVKRELRLNKEKAKLANLYATLSQINQAIIREDDKAKLILKITALPVNYGNFKACGLSLVESETGLLKVESFSGDFNYFNEILNEDSSYRIDDPGVQSFMKNKTVIVNNVNDNPEEWTQIAEENNIKSCAAAPIVVSGRIIGTIVLYSDEQNYFLDNEIKLVEEIASDIAFSIDIIAKNKIRKQIESQLIEHERQLSTLFSNLPGIAYRCKYDRDWTMELMSDGTLNLTGYTPEEFIDKKVITYDDLIHEDDRQFVWDAISDAVKQHKSFTVIYRIKPKDYNGHRWVWERGLPVYDKNSNAIALEGFISDITERKDAEEQLQKSEESFKYLFQHNPLPMWIYDLYTYQFMEVNEAAIEDYGYSRDEFLNMSILDIRPDSEKEKLEADLKQERKERTDSGEWKHKLKNDEVIDVLIISHKIKYQNKAAVLVVSLNITDRKRAELDLIKAKEEAEKADKLKSDFLAQMSHEIRTPINVILSFSHLIKEEVYNKIKNDIREGFNAIDSASQRLIKTIDSILNMAQFARGTFKAVPTTFDLIETVLTPLHDEFRSVAKSKKLDFRILNYCLDTTVYADKYSLSQIFANLIDNALKYTSKGSVKVVVDCKDDKLAVKIIDTGIGISKEYLPNLFTEFSQEESGYSRRFEGTGLGLALVKNYCDINNAEISVESKKNVGTTFTVECPRPKK
ncbi:MAG: PAS domain S-box protein [Melioribacteraceae bacterium]|nr:PAS domain S-box protein [Melioribacteraceae bacterium]